MADKKKKKQNIPDQLQTWKPPYFKWLLVLIGCGYVGLLLGCNYRKGDTVYELLEQEICLTLVLQMACISLVHLQHAL